MHSQDSAAELSARGHASVSSYGGAMTALLAMEKRMAGLTWVDALRERVHVVEAVERGDGGRGRRGPEGDAEDGAAVQHRQLLRRVGARRQPPARRSTSGERSG